MKSGLRELNINSIDGSDWYVNADLVDKAVCGGYDGQFRCTASIRTRRLDKSGFVLDNHKFLELVQQAFDGGTFKASCEELAEGVAFVAWELMGARLEKIVTQVYNRTGHATYVWEVGDERPEFPRKGTRKEILDSEGPSRGC